MKRIILISVLLTVSLLSACATHVGNVSATDTTAIEKIKIGKSTKAQVKELLSDPTNIEISGDMREIWSYDYTKTEISARAFVPLLNIIGEQSVQSKSSSLTIKFNKNGIVEDINKKTGGGVKSDTLTKSQ